MSATVGWDRIGHGPHGGAGPAARGIGGLVRTACTPANGLSAGALALGWLALVAWTGAGPEGWQARTCAGLDLRPAACTTVPARKDESRIAPHTAPARTPA